MALQRRRWIVSIDDFDVSDVLEDDVMLVTVADGEVQSIGTPETLSAVEISSFKVGDSLTADGTDYDYADSAEYDVDTLEKWTDGQDHQPEGPDLQRLSGSVRLCHRCG